MVMMMGHEQREQHLNSQPEHQRVREVAGIQIPFHCASELRIYSPIGSGRRRGLTSAVIFGAELGQGCSSPQTQLDAIDVIGAQYDDL